MKSALEITQTVLWSFTAVAFLAAACMMRAAVLMRRAASAIRAGDPDLGRNLTRRARRWVWFDRLTPKRWRIDLGSEAGR